MTLQLEQVPKQDKDSKIYLVIVGADGRKFNSIQEQKAKDLISRILHAMKSKELLIPPIEFKNNEVWNAHLKPIEYESLTVVSGHCPVGEERLYCVDWDMFIPSKEHPEAVEWHKEEGHKLVKVYDKGGIDTFVEIIATKLGIQTKIFKPEHKGWEDKVTEIPFNENEVAEHKMDKSLLRKDGYYYYEKFVRKGFRSRNIDMAKIGTIGYTIEVVGSCRHCNGTGKQKKADEEGDGWYYDQDELCNKCKGTGAYSGGTFTINEMKKLGKEMHKIVIK